MLPPTVRIFLCLTPADMRRSLDGLAAMTREVLREDPLSAGTSSSSSIAGAIGSRFFSGIVRGWPFITSVSRRARFGLSAFEAFELSARRRSSRRSWP